MQQKCIAAFFFFFLQKEVEKVIKVAWEIFQPFLFGLIGAEISVASLDPQTVGKSSTNKWAFMPIVFGGVSLSEGKLYHSVVEMILFLIPEIIKSISLLQDFALPHWLLD